MIKELSLLFGIVLIACYLAFAFVNWDIVWVIHVDTIARCFLSCFLWHSFLCFQRLIWRVKINNYERNNN